MQCGNCFCCFTKHVYFATDTETTFSDVKGTKNTYAGTQQRDAQAVISQPGGQVHPRQHKRIWFRGHAGNGTSINSCWPPTRYTTTWCIRELSEWQFCRTLSGTTMEVQCIPGIVEETGSMDTLISGDQSTHADQPPTRQTAEKSANQRTTVITVKHFLALWRSRMLEASTKKLVQWTVISQVRTSSNRSTMKKMQNINHQRSAKEWRLNRSVQTTWRFAPMSFSM